MTQPIKSWKPGKADEVWKIMICARDAERADDLMNGLVYILTGSGSDTKSGLEAIAGMSGWQIVDALIAYKQSAYESVRAALPTREPAE